MMNIHEYQAKQVLNAYEIPILKGGIASSPGEAVKVATEMGGAVWVVKAQIHAGGRGKAGGVILARSIEEVKTAAAKILGQVLVTQQTGPQGQLVRKVYVEEGCEIDKEFYLSMIVNRQTESVSIMVSQAGGMDIEEVAAKSPEKLMTFSIDPIAGFQQFHGRKAAFALGLEGVAVKEMGLFLAGLYQAFTTLDCDLVEINPLVLTKQGHLIALDAKVTFEDNGLSRHPNIESLRDKDEEDPAETKAREYDLSYVKLDGNIGCMVNGAGLAMATMDIIKLHGGEPANFLDVGGGATKEKVAAAFKLILADTNVRAILINIFGGIMRCDVIAEGIVAAAKEVQLSVPMVVRLQGTNGELGKKILKESNLKIISKDDLSQAAACVVKAIKEAA